MSIENSNYCRTGLGVGKPECCSCGSDCTKGRTLSGGPGLSDELDKAGTITSTGITLLLPDFVKTKQDLSKYLGTLYKRGSVEYDEAYGALSGSFKFETKI